MVRQDPFFVNLTPELIDRAQKRLEFIINEGCTKNGIDESIDTKQKPDWYDEERLKRSQAVANKYYGASVNGTIVGLLVFLQLPIGLAPLLATGKSKNLATLFIRYFNTMQFIDEWFTSDPFDPKSKSFKSLALVRTMHLNANKSMNGKISVYEFAKRALKEQDPNIDETQIEQFIRSKDRVWLSMFDMALVQWAFLGCLILEPIASGLHGATKQDVEDIMYLWKVITYKLGMNGKYSILDECEYDICYAYCKLILEQEYLLNMENVTARTGIRMSVAVLAVFKDIFTGANCNVFLKYWYKILNVNSYKLNRVKYEDDKIELFKPHKKNRLSEEERELMLKNGYHDKYIVSNPEVPFEEFQLSGLKERIMYRLYLIFVNYFLKFDFGRNFVRGYLKNSVIKTREARKEITAKLEKKKVERFEFSECPFTGPDKILNTPDYSNALDMFDKKEETN